MEKVVHLFEIFKSIFYSKFLDLKKVKFGSVKFWKSLNIFEPFEFEKWGTVAGAHRSARTSPQFCGSQATWPRHATHLHPSVGAGHPPGPCLPRGATPPI
jgi:hypothetical protein